MYIMSHYNVSVFNDMGHIMLEPWIDKLPEHITNFVLFKAQMYLRLATDTSGLGCRFYILPDGFQQKWNYNCENDTITIDWNVNTFNQENMRWL
jgi:hypothetical protein